MEILVAVVLVVVMGGICWSLLAPPTEYGIRYSRGSVRFSGKFPGSRRTEVEEFFKREFPGSGPIKVAAIRTPQRGLRFVIRGRMPDGDRQRIRNFLRTFV